MPPTPQQTTPSPSESTSISSSSGTTGGEDSSASSSAALPPPQPPQLHPMAFTVDFTDLGGSKRLDIGDSISKFVPRHRRNLSVSRQEEAKQQRQEKLQQQESAAEQQRGKQPQSPTSRQPQQAPSPTLARHPPAPSQSPTPRHNPSQSPNNSRHNAVTPPSRPNAAAAAAAAPTQSPTSRQAPPVAQLQMRRAGYHSEGYFSSDQEEDLSTKSDLSVRKAKGLEKGPGRTTNLAQEKRTKPEPLPLANPEVSRPSGLMDRRSASLEESASEHFSRILGETTSPVRRQASCGTQDEGSCRSRQCQASSPQSTEVQPDSEDNVSEAGTYTIDKESPSPEEKRARNEIDVVFGVQDVPTSPMCDTRTFTRPTASYRGGPNWIKEWAAQVAEQQRDLESVQLPSRGRVSPGGRGAPTSPLLSPVMGWPPPSQQQQPQQPMEPAGLRGPRHKLQQVSAASPVLSDHSDPTESPARRRPIQLQPDTETESYLRTTESVVTAMQARVTAAEEGPSAEELSAQLRARLRVLEHKASSVPPPQPAPGPVRKLAARTQPRVSGEGQSDSSSEAGDKPPRSRADSAGPHTRYNRAFSLRRARLEAEEAERNRAAKPVSAPISARVIPKVQRPAANPARTPLSSGNKKSSSSSARSNSSLHAREVEFQNWKRRKSYDPMKAAAEGKKKAEAARKTGGQAQQQANVMTQSAIVPNTNSSPHSSPLNSILRSASFHGTGGVARQMLRHQHGSSAATSEDEATLSAEEDEDEALDNLVIAAIHGFSNKIKGSSHNVLSKLRVLFQEDPEKASMLEETLALLEEGEPPTSSPSKMLDEVLFGDEEILDDEDEDLEVEEEEEELSDLEADQLQAI
ncbi:hypothetical protein B566_EDAN017924 [Ephemera danica]|nr:hypothetical protein B566_EDAN017924 [Ephemera danica]